MSGHHEATHVSLAAFSASIKSGSKLLLGHVCKPTTSPCPAGSPSSAFARSCCPPLSLLFAHAQVCSLCRAAGCHAGTHSFSVLVQSEWNFQMNCSVLLVKTLMTVIGSLSWLQKTSTEQGSRNVIYVPPRLHNCTLPLNRTDLTFRGLMASSSHEKQKALHSLHFHMSGHAISMAVLRWESSELEMCRKGSK